MANSGTEIVNNATPDTTGEKVLQDYTDRARNSLDMSLALTNKITDGTSIKTVPSDVEPVIIQDLEAFAGTPIAANITEIDMTLSSHAGKLIAGSAIQVTCVGQTAFLGVLVTVNLASTSAALAAMAMYDGSAGNAPAASDHKEVFLCPAGKVITIPYNETLGLVHIVALDTVTSEVNFVQVSAI